jgi:3-oxoacyl-[acyl-carrier protein] reductase
MDRLLAKVALVTGGDRGIGRGIAIAMAKEGADVAVNFRADADAARDTCELIRAHGQRCLTVQADVSKGDDVKHMVEVIEKELGPVEILVNNAGITRPQPLAEIREEDWDQVIDVNLKSVFLVTQAVVSGMRSRHWGRIINLSSVAAQTGGVVGPHYAASKAGILGLTHSYAALLVKDGITANAIAPALIETDMVKANPRANASLIPVGRFGAIEEVADVAVMLACNGYITGQTISVNGGWYFT